MISLMLLAMPQEAEVSQIHFREISLQEMAERSQAVYLVTAADPFREIQDIDIRTPAQKLFPDSKEKYPPYQKMLLHFEISEVLHGPAPENKRGHRIAVRGANSEAQLRMHRSYYQEGLSRSPIYDQYSGQGANLEAEDTAIIFVHPLENNQYVFTCENAIIPIIDRKKVVRILAKIKKKTKDQTIRLP